MLKEKELQELQMLKEKVKKLEDELEFYKQDEIASIYYAQKRKCNEMASSLNSCVIDLSSDDKVFDRWIKLSSNIKVTVELLEWMNAKYIKTDEDKKKEKESKKATNILEDFVEKEKNKKQESLKDN